jgi:spore germination protein GerM
MKRRLAITAVMTLLAVSIGWVLFVGLPRWTAPRLATTAPPAPSAAAPATPSTPAEPTRHIRARLYYMGADAVSLQPVDSEVELGETPRDQARHLLEALLTTPQAPVVSAIPAGTRLRSLYLTPAGIAYVDLSGEVSSKHPGGVLQELLTVYSVVYTLTENLPAVTSVQLLVDGRETDTLAGHVDLRQPLSKNAQWAAAAPAPPQ